jgi:hypothetical protein
MTDLPEMVREQMNRNAHQDRILTAEEVQAREDVAWRLRQRGWSVARIADELGVSTLMAQKILVRPMRRALHQTLRNMDVLCIDQSIRLDLIFDQAMHAWFRSLEHPPRQVQGRGAGGETESSPESKSAWGDVRLLREARAALEAKKQLWELDREAFRVKESPSLSESKRAREAADGPSQPGPWDDTVGRANAPAASAPAPAAAASSGTGTVDAAGLNAADRALIAQFARKLVADVVPSQPTQST